MADDVDRDADATLAAMRQELAGLPPMTVVLEPATVLAMAGLVQLALRHPGVAGSPRDAGDRWMAGVRHYFAGCPATLAVLRRGDDPAEDRRA